MRELSSFDGEAYEGYEVVSDFAVVDVCDEAFDYVVGFKFPDAVVDRPLGDVEFSCDVPVALSRVFRQFLDYRSNNLGGHYVRQ